MKHLNGATVAVIGVGGMGLRHIKACRLVGANVVALCDVHDDALAAGLKEAPGASTYRSVSQCIASVVNRVDLVSVVTNAPSRAKILLELAEGGARRVLTEKPFTTNVGDAYSVVDAYEKTGVPLTVNTYRHFSDNHRRLREMLRSGKLGTEVVRIRVPQRVRDDLDLISAPAGLQASIRDGLPARHGCEVGRGRSAVDPMPVGHPGISRGPAATCTGPARRACEGPSSGTLAGSAWSATRTGRGDSSTPAKTQESRTPSIL